MHLKQSTDYLNTIYSEYLNIEGPPSQLSDFMKATAILKICKDAHRGKPMSAYVYQKANVLVFGIQSASQTRLGNHCFTLCQNYGNLTHKMECFTYPYIRYWIVHTVYFTF